MSPEERKFHLACHNLRARIRQAISEFEKETAEERFYCAASRQIVEEQGIGD